MFSCTALLMTMTRHKNIFILNNFSSRTETITQNEVYRIFRSFTLFFKFTWPCIVTNFFVIKPTRCTSFTKLFCYETLHISDSSSVHYQEFYSLYTQQWYMSYRFVDSFRAGPGLVLLESCMTYTIAECTVNKLLMMDRRTVQNMYSFMTK